MTPQLRVNKIPQRHQPKGYKVLHDDEAIIVGNKAAGFLTVGALYDRVHTIHQALNDYVRKGDPRSRKCAFVVHRLDRETSGLLIFARTIEAQMTLKNNWKNVTKTYYAVVHGRMPHKAATITSYLAEDEDYVVHSTADSEQGKLAHTEYVVVRESSRFSLLKINLLTGRKNQIRVHLSGEGHPVVGDTKYGTSQTRYARMALHAQAISFPHPVTGQQMNFATNLPDIFDSLVPGDSGLDLPVAPAR